MSTRGSRLTGPTIPLSLWERERWKLLPLLTRTVLRAPRSGTVERCEREHSEREQQGLDPGHPEHLLPPEEPGHRNASVPKRGSLLLSSGDPGLTMSPAVIKMNRVPEGVAGAEETIGQRLRRLRLERGLSQRELSE